MTEWLPTASQAGDAAAAALESNLNSNRPTFSTPIVLPYHLSLLPSTFRLLAVLFFLPVLLLSFADLVGYVVFRLFLRPLGYASTTRFKDPEPTTFIEHQPGRRSRSSSRPNASRKTAAELGAGVNLSRTSSLPASFRSHHAVTADALRAAAATADGTTQVGSPLVGQLTPPASSNGSSPVMTYSDSIASSPTSSHAPSLASSPTTSPKGLLSALPPAGQRNLGQAVNSSSSGKSKKPRRRSHSGSISELRRFRAPSVGFDGPLLFASGSGADSEDGLISPLRSDDEAEQSMSAIMNRTGSAATSGDDSEGSAGDEDGSNSTSGLRRRKKEGGGMRRGPGFGFTEIP